MVRWVKEQLPELGFRHDFGTVRTSYHRLSSDLYLQASGLWVYASGVRGADAVDPETGAGTFPTHGFLFTLAGTWDQTTPALDHGYLVKPVPDDDPDPELQLMVFQEQAPNYGLPIGTYTGRRFIDLTGIDVYPSLSISFTLTTGEWPDVSGISWDSPIQGSYCKATILYKIED